MIFKGATRSVIFREMKGQDFLNLPEEALDLTFHSMTFLRVFTSTFFLSPPPPQQILQSAK